MLDTSGFRAFPKYLPELQDAARTANLPDFTGDVVVLDLSNTSLNPDAYEGATVYTHLEREFTILPYPPQSPLTKGKPQFSPLVRGPD